MNDARIMLEIGDTVEVEGIVGKVTDIFLSDCLVEIEKTDGTKTKVDLYRIHRILQAKGLGNE